VKWSDLKKNNLGVYGKLVKEYINKLAEGNVNPPRYILHLSARPLGEQVT
jgi:hypothetical protein